MDEMQKIERASWLKIVLWIVVIIAALWFLHSIYKTIIVFSIAFLITYLFNPVVVWLSSIKVPFTRSKLPRWASVVIVYLFLLLIIAVAVIIIVPVLLNQVNNLIASIPDHVVKVKEAAVQWQLKYEKLKISPQVQENIQSVLTQGVGKLGEWMAIFFQQLFNFVVGIASGIFFLITALIIALFILVNLDSIKARVYSYFPPSYRQEFHHLFDEMNTIFGGFIRGSIILGLITGVLTYILLEILGYISPQYQYNYTLIIGLLNGVTYPIPILGVLVSSIVGGILAYFQSGSWGYTAIIFLIVLGVNKIVDQFICPKVMSETMGVSPIFIIFAAFAGGELMGVWGMILGIPMAAMAKVVLRYIHRRFLALETDDENPVPSA